MQDKELKDTLMKVIEILSTPEDSDEIWYCVGQLEDIVKQLNAKNKGE